MDRPDKAYMANPKKHHGRAPRRQGVSEGSNGWSGPSSKATGSSPQSPSAEASSPYTASWQSLADLEPVCRLLFCPF